MPIERQFAGKQPKPQFLRPMPKLKQTRRYRPGKVLYKSEQRFRVTYLTFKI